MSDIIVTDNNFNNGYLSENADFICNGKVKEKV